jgi:hypothetical protein
MNLIAANVIAVSLIALATGGPALATVPNIGALDLTGAQPQDLQSDVLTFTSGLVSASAFTNALTLTWQSYATAYGPSAGVTNFENAIEAYYNSTPASGQVTFFANWSVNTSVFQNVLNQPWNVTFNAGAGSYQVGNTIYSLNAPGPVAGTGLFTLIAAASLAGLAMRKRGETAR